MNDEIRKYKEKNIYLDTEVTGLSPELEKLSKHKEDLIFENEEHKRKIAFLEITIESLKSTHHQDITRMKAHINDMEKINDKVHKGIIHLIQFNISSHS